MQKEAAPGLITLYEDKRDCYGCTACVSACPAGAITMEYDREGFLYPLIDASACSGCGRCREVCPAAGSGAAEHNEGSGEPVVYAFKHGDRETRMRSSSGGAYTAISDAVIDHYGKSALYGVSFDPDFGVRHARAATRAERNGFRGSKYVQSDLGNTFCQIAADLKNDLTVLFTGTPCQVAGLLNFLKMEHIDPGRLITNDLICFGVPSPLLWKEYIGFISRKSGIARYSFRHKGPGLKEAHNIHVEYRDGRARDNTPGLVIYERLFGAALMLRPCCYKCRFAGINRPSDITIGDYPAIFEAHPGFGDDLGVSLVICNTGKGLRLFDIADREGEVILSSTRKCLQNRLRGPTPEPARRALFWHDYTRHGFLHAARKYGGYDFKNRLKFAIKYVLTRLGFAAPGGGGKRRSRRAGDKYTGRHHAE